LPVRSIVWRAIQTPRLITRRVWRKSSTPSKRRFSARIPPELRQEAALLHQATALLHQAAAALRPLPVLALHLLFLFPLPQLLQPLVPAPALLPTELLQPLVPPAPPLLLMLLLELLNPVVFPLLRL
jgi:hypothetical protein